MATLPRLSEESEESFDSYGNPRRSTETMNFSRPQRPRGSSIHSHRSQYSSAPKASSDTHATQGNVHSINAFHESNRDFPDEPRFSLDSDSTANNPSDVSAGSSDFAWDGRRGELRTKTTPVERFEQQRFQPSPKPRRPEPRNSHSTRSSFDRSNEPLYQPIQTKISAGNSNDLAIMKRISVDQQSERISISTDARDDERSQNTASDDDIGSGSFDGEGNWQSSNYETTGLSDAQIRKLLKKGINPNLYAEMKAAKKGKGRWGVGPLLGNSFLG